MSICHGSGWDGAAGFDSKLAQGSGSGGFSQSFDRADVCHEVGSGCADLLLTFPATSKSPQPSSSSWAAGTGTGDWIPPPNPGLPIEFPQLLPTVDCG